MSEWIWVSITLSVLFLLFVVYRVSYIVGYRKGAQRIVAEWRQTLEEEMDNE